VKRQQHLLLTQRNKEGKIPVSPIEFEVPGPDELDLANFDNTLRVRHIEEEEVSDYVKLRLFMSRFLALKKYDEKWG